MKKTIIIMMMFILLLPLTFAFDKITVSLYGGQTWHYIFPECDKLKVNITAIDTIDIGEYTILSNCTFNGTNYYLCNCTNNYNFTVKFHPGAVNNYTFNFNYAYSNVIEEQQSSGGGGSSSRSRTKVCTPDWKCTEWGNCQSNNRATRTCTSLNECNATRPSEERYCYYYVAPTEPIQEEAEVIEQVEVTEPIEQPEPQKEKKGIPFKWWVFIGVLILTIIIIIVFIFKNRDNEKYL